MNGESCGTSQEGRFHCRSFQCHLGVAHKQPNMLVNIREPVYKCCNSKKAETCDLGIIRESTLRELVVDVWNDIVAHQDRYQDHWNRMIEEGDALEKLRARQMMALVKEGPLSAECPEMTKMILREITVMDSMNFRVVLMDGTEKTVYMDKKMALGA